MDYPKNTLLILSEESPSTIKVILRALRLWLTSRFGFEVALLLIFNRLANLVGMLKGLREYKRRLRQQCV